MALTATQERRLARLHNRGTFYEVTATGEGRTILVGYMRPGARALRDLLMGLLDGRPRVYRLAEMTGTDPLAWEMAAGRQARATGGGWTVQFSGRTQRAAIIEGEPPESLYAPPPPAP